MTSKVKSKKLIELKELGDNCLKSGSYAEAVLHYSHALRLEPNESKLLSNRSVAFLRLQQYYYAYEDAKQIIRLCDHWFKGYYRRAEVEVECGHYAEAIKSYYLSLQYLSEEKSCDSEETKKTETAINTAIQKCINNDRKQKVQDLQIPWIGSALGLVCGMALITCDFIINNAIPLVRHPMLKLLIIGCVSALFFYLAKLQRNYTKNYRESLLKPPIDLFNN